VSLAVSPLGPERQRQVVDACARHLLISFGLRRFAPWHPLVRVHGDPATARAFLEPLDHHLDEFGVGSIAEIFEGERREEAAHRAAEPRVMRRVAEEHRLAVPAASRRTVGACGAVAAWGRRAARPEVTLEALAPEPRVAEDHRDVRVTREDPEAVRRPVDRVLGAEARVAGIGVDVGRGGGRAEEGAVLPGRVERCACHGRLERQPGCQAVGGWQTV
jgi:hypothetical protein